MSNNLTKQQSHYFQELDDLVKKVEELQMRSVSYFESNKYISKYIKWQYFIMNLYDDNDNKFKFKKLEY